jgi:hypothetical protein
LEVKIAHPVELIPAKAAESCWAAAALALFGGTRPLGARAISPLASGDSNGDGPADSATPLHVGPSTLAEFSQQWGLTLLRPRDWTVDALATLLERRPLWLGAYRPNGHAMVLAGMLGDGTPGGTHLTILDPLPPQTGAVHRLPFSVFAARYSLAAMHVLHRPVRQSAVPADPLAGLKSVVGADWELS